jgi:UDP-GlcNAc:undecaprenyl-phosphate/decaprenyl-phosphate GlcNAc-1-phosphate transferase
MESISFIILYGFIVCIASNLFLQVLREIIIELNLIPKQKTRDIHNTPIPSLLGLGFGFLLLISTYFFNDIYPIYFGYWSFIISFLVIIFLGAFDDIFTLGSYKKLIFQILAIFILLSYNDNLVIDNLNFFLGITEIPDPFNLIFTGFIGIIMINGLNLIDGIDGFAAIISIACFSLFGGVFFMIDNYPMLILATAYIAIIIGYIPINISKTKKGFMGDSGSLFLGFGLYVFTLVFIQSDYSVLLNTIVPSKSLLPLIPLTIFFIPILDILSIYSYRISIGKNPLMADNFHLHHMLIWFTGLSHLSVSALTGLFIVVLSLAFLMLSNFLSPQYVIAVYFVFLFLLIIILNRYKPVMRSKIGDSHGNIESV